MSVTIEPAGAQRSPAWSPDGGSIAFASNHEVIANYHAWQIYTVRVDGSGLERRTSDRAEKGNPAWIRR
jgi:Tol biopolymer transport system component